MSHEPMLALWAGEHMAHAVGAAQASIEGRE